MDRCALETSAPVRRLRLRPRAGMTMALVLSAAFFALFLWSQNFSRVSNLVAMQQRTGTGYTGGPRPNRAMAAAQAIACLRVQLPPAAGTCKLTLGTGANQKIFSVKYTDRGGGLDDIEVTDGDFGYLACPACSAGGP